MKPDDDDSWQPHDLGLGSLPPYQLLEMEMKTDGLRKPLDALKAEVWQTEEGLEVGAVVASEVRPEHPSRSQDRRSSSRAQPMGGKAETDHGHEVGHGSAAQSWLGRRHGEQQRVLGAHLEIGFRQLDGYASALHRKKQQAAETRHR